MSTVLRQPNIDVASPACPTGPREFLPKDVNRPPRKAQVAKLPAAAPAFDYPATLVGTVGNISVYYDPSLGAPGQTLATQMLGRVIGPYVDMEAYFGVSGGAVNIVISPLSAANDGSGGAYHYGCDFNSGGTLYLDATFGNTGINPLDLETLLYVAELSECFMGTQGKGWGCGFSNGEGLSRYLATRETPPGTLPQWGVTGPSWVSAGYPDWVTTTENTDQDYASTGCAILYIYWMRSLGFSALQIVQAAGATLADNYQTLTGKTSAYADLKAAVSALTVTSDNPFAAAPATWHQNDLSADTGAPAAVGSPSGYMFVAQNTQHAVYRDANGHIQELYWNGSWNKNDLTQAAGAPAAAGDPAGYVFDAQGTQHVVYRDANGHIQELYWDGSWHNNDLTQASGSPPAAGNPIGYVFDAQGTQHVMYRDTNGHIQELWWNGSWHNDDLNAQTGAPLAAGDPCGYMFDNQGTQHVMYRDVGGHIQELWWNGQWNNDDLNAQTGAPLAAGDPCGYLFADQGTQHVMYRDVNGHIQELWWNGQWHNDDLNAQTGAAGAASDPTCYAYEVQGTQHVMYRDVNGQIQELWWNGQWNDNDLTADTGSALATGHPTAYLFAAQDTQHVIYVGVDQAIHELWWG